MTVNSTIPQNLNCSRNHLICLNRPGTAADSNNPAPMTFISGKCEAIHTKRRMGCLPGKLRLFRQNESLLQRRIGHYRVSCRKMLLDGSNRAT